MKLLKHKVSLIKRSSFKGSDRPSVTRRRRTESRGSYRCIACLCMWVGGWACCVCMCGCVCVGELVPVCVSVCVHMLCVCVRCLSVWICCVAL